VLIDGNENILAEPKAYDLKVENFVKFLDAGKQAFAAKNAQ
jgi:thiol:disulfide interchange protein DsbD